MLPRVRNARGQAMTETILLTWILLAFIAAIYQLFLVNQSVYASLTAVHTRLFEQAFERNCPDDNPRCTYTTDNAGAGARVIWSSDQIPETRIAVVGMFKNALPAELRLESLRYGRGGFDHACPGLPCKRTKLGSGTYKGPISGLFELPGIVAGDGYLSSYLDDVDMYLLQEVLGGLIDHLF